MLKLLLKVMNSLISLAVVLAICLACAYSAYALWDNSRIYTAAEDVQADMLEIKPKPEPEHEEGGASFEELLAVNPDVCAWVTLEHTKVDYPVLQGNTNFTYINTDVYGEFALAGSIFLDAENDNTFHDAYSLLYGHHMEGGRMFGDLELYKDETFFRENHAGTLILPDRTYNLEIFAYLLLSASEDAIFRPGKWKTDINGLLDFTRENAQYLREGEIEYLRTARQPQVLAFSTCASEFTDARTIILAAMKPFAASEIGG